MSHEKTLEALRRAIQAEIEGQHFYAMAAACTQDPKGREVFETLATEEAAHADFLRDHLSSLFHDGRLHPEARLGTPSPLTGPSPIFSESLRERVGQAHFEMTALSIGIQLEADAQHFYRLQAENAQDETLRGFFLTLADWESIHYHALLAQHEALKEAWWAESGFAPF
jgi:rubrerythrin